MIRCGPQAVEAEHPGQLSEEGRLKLRSTVSDNVQRHAEPGHPDVHEGGCDGGGRDICQRSRLDPAGSAVHAGQQVPVRGGERRTVRDGWRQRTDDVDMHRLKPVTQNREVSWDGLGMAMDFARLAGMTTADPLADTAVHIGPEVS